MEISAIHTLQALGDVAPQELASHTGFWDNVRQLYKPSPDFINLEHGYYGALPTPLLDAYKAHIDQLNAVASFYMRREQPQDMVRLKARLAPILGSAPEEIAFSRNATESLNVILNGIDLQAGEEILLSAYDYPSALDACAQRSRRYGTPYRVMTELLYTKTDAEIVAYLESQIQPQTRLLVVTHLVHYTGQILPVRAITEMARRKGVEILVDSSHAVAQIDFQLSEIGCDYWVGNLHKWLYAPLTAGILAVRKDKIHRVWGLLGDNTYADTDIRKLERFSALPMPTFLSIFDAVEFHEALGIARKSARLHYLQRYWTDKLREMPLVTVYTPADRSCAIGAFSIKGLPAATVAERLLEQYKIFSSTFTVGELEAVRVTPQLYTNTQELDSLVRAVGEICRELA